MGFWGKTIGAGLGFMVGGPIGAILGGVLGHSFDVESDQRRYGSHGYGQGPDDWPELEREFDRQYLFYVSLASLAAKMAKVDGQVTHDEIRAFDHFLRYDLGLIIEERKQVAKIFNEAKNSPEEAAAIAQQFRALIGFQHDVLQMMIQLLFRIALADGTLHKQEEQFIQQMSAIFGFSPQAYQQIKALYIKPTDGAYAILGVERTASNDEIKKAYRQLSREYHPDRLQAKGVPEDFLKVAQEKMAAINQAYSDIRKERNF